MSRRGDVIGIVGLVALAWLRLLTCVVDGRVPLLDDTRAQLYPWYAALFAEIRAGRWPGWSPEVFLGFPLAASVETHLFSPLNLPFLFLAPRPAMAVHFGLAWSLASVSAFLLARHLGARIGGALAAGILWGVGSHALIALTEAYSLATYAWFPLIWLCWDRLLTVARPRAWAIGCGLAMGASLLGGHLQHAYGFVLFLAGFTLIRVREGLRIRRAARPAALAIAIALGLSAVSLWPSLAIASESVRAHVEPAHRLRAAFDVRDALRWLFPDVEMNPPEPEGLQCAPLGWSTIALALFACGRGRRVENGVAVLAFVFLLLAMGGLFPPAAGVIASLPGFSFRDPHRFFVLSTLAVSMLVARGTDALSGVAHDGPSAARLGLRAFGLAVLSGLAALAWGLPAGMGWPEIAAAGLPAVLALIARGWSPGRSRPWSGVSVVLVVLGLLLSTSGRGAWVRAANVPGIEETLPSYLRTLPRSDAWGPVRLVILPGLAAMGSNDVLLTGHHAAGGYASLTPYRLSRLFSVGRAFDPFSYERRDDFDFVSRPRLLDLLNVRFLVATDSAERSGPVLVERATYLPRAFFVSNAVHLADEEDAFQAVTAASFDPRDHVVLENAPAAEREAANAGSGTRGLYAPATVTSYAAQQVSVDVDAPTSGWLVLLDAFAPGWSCRVNGTTEPIRRADYLFRAVRVGPGRTRAVFIYSDPALRLGAVVSVGTGLLALLGLASGLRSPRKGHEP